MKHLMHQDTLSRKDVISASLTDQKFFRFMDEFTVYRIVLCGTDRFLLDSGEGILFSEDANRPIVEVELFRVHRRECIYKDKVIQNAEDEKSNQG